MLHSFHIQGMPYMPHTTHVQTMLNDGAARGSAGHMARKPFSLYLSEEALARLDVRAAEAARLVGVRVTAPAIAASLLHRALGLSSDGEPLESAAAPLPGDAPPVPPVEAPAALPPASSPPTPATPHVEAEPPPPEPETADESSEADERPASSPPPEPAGDESAADVLATFGTLARVKGDAKRRSILAGYVKELQTRCNLSAAGALALLREKETKRRLRVTTADLDAAAKGAK